MKTIRLPTRQDALTKMPDESVIGAMIGNAVPGIFGLTGPTYSIPVAVIEVMPGRLFIHIFAGDADASKNELSFVVTNAVDEPSPKEPSLGLDGTRIFLRGIGLAGQITLGRCLIRAEEPVELALKDQAGKFLRISRVNMSNAETEQNGINAVVEYEKKHGRPDVQRVYKCGYDLVSKGIGSERHIEVKTTGKDIFSFRWLEQLEYDTMKKDGNWYLYLVTDANGTPRVFEYNRERAERRFSEEMRHYVFVFPKSDFK